MTDADGKLVLGVDGGGTSTVAIVALAMPGEELEFIARGFAGSSNPHRVGWEAALTSISQAVNQAAQVVGVSRFESGCFSIAGCGRPGEQSRLMDWLEKQHLANTTVAIDDGQAVLRAGTSSGIGVAVIAGTGSLVMGHNATSGTIRAGGWGFLLGDEGSGFALGLEGLRAVTVAADGVGPPTELTDQILACCEVNAATDLIRWVYSEGIDRGQIASLAPIVLEAAENRDEVALSIVWRQLHALERQIRTVVGRLDLPEQDYDIALAGGVLVNSDLFRSRLLAELQLPADRVGMVEEPAQGAALIAADLAS